MHANLKECSLVVDLHSTNLKEFKNLVYQSISVRSPQEDLGALVKCDSKLQHPRTVWRVGITCAAPAFRNATTIAEVGGERIYQQWCNSSLFTDGKALRTCPSIPSSLTFKGKITAK